MAYIQDINLDLNPTSNQVVVVSAKQYDEGNTRGIRAHITKNGNSYSFTGTSFLLRVIKPDGHIVISTANFTPDAGGTITAMFSDQCLVVAGKATADIVEVGPKQEILSTASFVLNITPSPMPSNHKFISTDEFTALYSYIQSASSTEQRIQNLIDQAQSLDGYSNPNLIDNWYFIGGGSQLGDGIFPINQNGKKFYNYGSTIESRSAQYTIDRWKANSPNIQVGLDVNYLHVKNEDTNSQDLLQILNIDYSSVAGKKLTLSVLFRNQTLQFATSIIPDNLFATTEDPDTQQFIIITVNTVGKFTFGYSKQFKKLYVAMRLNSNQIVDLIGIKLEFGERQTLAQYNSTDNKYYIISIPNYNLELSKCKTFFTNAYPHVNPNLLDNWYFVGGGSQQTALRSTAFFPINQRINDDSGNTTYAATNAKNTIDRWLLSNGYLQLTDSGVTITGDGQTASDKLHEFVQRLPLNFKTLAGKTLTVSILINNSELITGSGTVPEVQPTSFINIILVKFGNENDYTLTFSFSSGLNCFEVRAIVPTNKSCTLTAFKLELGNEQTLVQWLANKYEISSIPDYREQLQACQHYFYRFKPTETCAFATGFYTDSTHVQFTGNLGIPFRSTATATVSSNGVISVISPGHLGISGSSSLTASSPVIKMYPNGVISGSVTTNQATSGAPAIVRIANTGYIDFSAEL